MTQFALSGLAALVLVAVGGVLVLRSLGTDEEIRDAQEVTRVIGKGIIEPRLTEELLAGDAEAIEDLDDVVMDHVLEDPVVRVKLWSVDGVIRYSDEPELIGEKYELEEEHLAVLGTEDVNAELSDLSEPENRLEQAEGQLLEVYMPVDGPSGKQLLFEAYLRFDSVVAGGRKTWLRFLPAALAALVLLAVLQIPLAWSMARRLREGQREREALLLQAIDASDAERRRIAGDLHDGVVQDLAGLSFSLAAAARGFDERGDRKAASELTRAASETRQRMRELRSLLVDIYPPKLHTAGIAAALSDLVSSLDARGVRVHVEIPEDLRLAPDVERLVFRTAQEALRNVQAHADAGAVEVRLERQNGRVILVVEDDGRGFVPDEVNGRPVAGHLGLTLLADLAAREGGELAVDSSPGKGTRLRLEVPAA